MLARSDWGTDRMPAPQIARALLEQRAIQVTDELEDGRRVLNPEASAAAQEKGAAMQERFAEWCWEQPARAARLLEEYNRRFNAIVLRDHTRDGERLTVPGLARSFVPRGHQRTAVARILNEPAVLLAHTVVAGKTAPMAIGAVELKRLGMVRKPVIVVRGPEPRVIRNRCLWLRGASRGRRWRHVANAPNLADAGLSASWAAGGGMSNQDRDAGARP